MPRGRRYAQTRDDRHHCSAETDFAEHIAAELRQQVRARGIFEQVCFDEESVACAQTNENGEERELEKQKPSIRRREKRLN